MDKKIYVECDCGTHLLRVEFDNELESGPSFYLAMFEYGGGRISLKWRLKTAWNILIRGKNHADQLIIDLEKATELKNFLDEIIKAIKENNKDKQ